MGISIADALFQPGFRFYPTDEELVLYYLKRKICRLRLKLDIIAETDVYKWDPEDLPSLSKLKTGDRQWFFFSPRDRKYPNGGRSNRATQHGYWKATGKDRTITCNSRTVGIKKTLVFYTGRAPSGGRTDWVMHEYTLDEDELKRCPAVQDYFALYKLFKKSGPGPKNGEQYGAPFKEEDWIDDDLSSMKSVFDQEGIVKHSNEVVPVSDHVEQPLNNLDEFINRIADEAVLDQPRVGNYEYILEQLMSEEEPQSTLGDNLLMEVYVADRSIEHQPQYLGCFAKSSASQLHLQEGPEVTSASSCHRLEPRVIEEDFLEDFLEMNDLNGPQPTAQDTHNPIKDLENFQLDGLCDCDLFEDAAMYLNEMESGERGQNSHPFMNNFERDEPRQVSNPYLNHFENEMLGPASHSHLYKFENETVSLQQQQVNRANQFSEVQNSSCFTPMEANQGAIPLSSSGMSRSNLNPGSNQNQNDNQDNDRTDSWFSSVVWSFVESIPTTPASAAESALVNKALERMSSFSRVRINSRNANVAPSAASRSRSVKSKNGLVVFSILGVLCAYFMCVNRNF